MSYLNYEGEKNKFFHTTARASALKPGFLVGLINQEGIKELWKVQDRTSQKGRNGGVTLVLENLQSLGTLETVEVDSENEAVLMGKKCARILLADLSNLLQY